MCIRYGIVPDAFFRATLVAILKKSNLDPTLPQNCRPIKISTTLSKVLEYYILEKCECHVFSENRFGFIPNRSTMMAAALAHDVATYSVASGSTLFFCSLEAQGAFDTLPHPIIFQKAGAGVILDKCWCIMLYWYKHIFINIKWKNSLRALVKKDLLLHSFLIFFLSRPSHRTAVR